MFCFTHLQRGLHVHQAVIAEGMAFRIQRRMRQEAEQVQPVVQGDDHQLALGDQLGGVIVVGGAVEIAAAMNPDQHRQLWLWCPA